MRSRLGHWLRKYADRIDYEHAPRHMGYSFTFETGEGIRFRDDGRGCGLWYLGDAEFEKAHAEADSATVDVRDAEQRTLIRIAMTEPDPKRAGEAAAELRRRIFQGVDGSQWEVSAPNDEGVTLPRSDGRYEAP
ncbi:hypothetical protein [Nocardia wallacei]|uniref:hypothetical protein n=1 Tax=Nocardia wallacei TaxID=480035 RepID=UPI00245843FB|nr:hypothetical protein [Nocardia wallacei]